MSKQVCDTCQQLFSGPMCPACEASEIDDLESRLEKQAEVIAVLREALEAYSNINHWDGYEFALMDKGDVCGYLKDGAPNGQRAREAIAKAEEILK